MPAKGLNHVPCNPAEEQRLLQERPPAWEFLLFAGALIRGRNDLEPKCTSTKQADVAPPSVS